MRGTSSVEYAAFCMHHTKSARMHRVCTVYAPCHPPLRIWAECRRVSVRCDAAQCACISARVLLCRDQSFLDMLPAMAHDHHNKRLNHGAPSNAGAGHGTRLLGACPASSGAAGCGEAHDTMLL